MLKSKREILEQIPELTLSTFGDFIVRKELVADYEIIDFHTHTFWGIAGMLPKPFRQPKEDFEASFFDLSCYPGHVKYFDINQIGFRTWPERLYSISGIETAIDMYGFGGVLFLVQKASNERLLRDMQAGNVQGAVVLPINAVKVESTANFLEHLPQNDQLYPFASLHPYEEHIPQKIESYLARGVKGFKVNPHIQKVNIDDPKMIALLKQLAGTKLPIISCSGQAIPDHFLRYLLQSLKNELETQNLQRYEQVLTQIPEATFIFAHGGVEQADELIPLMKKFPRTYTDISTQPPANIQRLIEQVGSQRLLFGSDYPFFNQAMPIVSVLRATQDENARKDVLGGNAMRLLNITKD